MKISVVLSLFTGSILFANAQTTHQSKNTPNFVIIIGDDCTHSDLPLYGGKNVKTPEINKLASQGVTFNKAYVSMAMCTPSRSELYTGLNPISSGVCWNHSKARSGVQSMVQMLAKHGYRTGLAGKTHIQPKEVFPFEMVEGLERNCVAQTADYDEAGLKEFMSRDSKKPFCLVVALVVPHVPWTVGDASTFDRSKLKLPPYLADTEVTRDVFAKYLAEIEVLDQQVGRTLAAINDLKLDDNTVVIFTSEQGAQLPFCKWTNYENGVHTAFIVRWPGVTKPGIRTNALIQYADVVPTFLDAIGDKNDYKLDGTSFLNVLKGETETSRKYAYSIHNNIPEGPSYPIRSITDGKYRYIRNLDNSNVYIEKHLMGANDTENYWRTWLFNSTNEHTNLLINRYMVRPVEELYNLDDDPSNLKNLANDIRYASVKEQLSNELDRWMIENGDPGKLLDTKKEFGAQKKGNHFSHLK